MRAGVFLFLFFFFTFVPYCVFQQLEHSTWHIVGIQTLLELAAGLFEETCIPNLKDAKALAGKE